MTEVTVLIDLDQLPERDEPARPARLPRPPRPAQWLVLFGVLFTLLAGGATVPVAAGPRLVRTVPNGPNPAFALHGGVLYVATSGTVGAYRLADNRPLWSQPMAGEVRGLAVQPSAGTLIVSESTADDTIMAVFDLATGAPLWQRDNINLQVVTGGRLVLATSRIEAAGTQLETAAGLDLRTGATVWSTRLAGWINGTTLGPAPGYEVNWIVVVETVKGVLRVVDAATGATVASGPTLNDLAQLADRQPASLGVVGTDLVVLADGKVSAIDLASLTVHWRAELPADVTDFDGCAPAICFYSEATTAFVDPATGTVRTRRSWIRPTELPDGRLLVTTGERTAVVDSALREVTELSQWSVAGLTDQLVLTRTGRSPGERWLGVLDPTVARVLPLGRVPLASVQGCIKDGRYLACRSESGIVALDLGAGARPG